MDDSNWKDLIDLICDGSVVPVVGPELLSVAAGDGARVSLDAVVARRFAAELNISVPPEVVRVRDVASAFITANTLKRSRTLKPNLARALKDLKEKPPALELLAAIEDFKLFVYVSPDSLLENAMNRAPVAGRPETIAITNAPNLKPSDLSADWRKYNARFVFYPFGRLQDGEFAITEEDILDYLFHLFKQPSRLDNLFNVLNSSHLLFLGCNFPDWLTRFWIRALAGKRLAEPRNQLELIADRCVKEDSNLVMFLKRTEIQVFSEGDAQDFVRTLHDRWRSTRRTSAPSDSKAVRHQVFISYSMTTDKAAAEEVNARLNKVGLKTWFDGDAIESGRCVREELERNIERSILFVPILSRGAAARQAGWYRNEWLWAIQCAEKRTGGPVPFIHPVIVDDLTQKSDGIPAAFWEVVGEPAPGGAVSGKFVARLKGLVRKAQL